MMHAKLETPYYNGLYSEGDRIGREYIVRNVYYQFVTPGLLKAEAEAKNEDEECQT